jgi:hypothetical protein
MHALSDLGSHGNSLDELEEERSHLPGHMLAQDLAETLKQLQMSRM